MHYTLGSNLGMDWKAQVDLFVCLEVCFWQRHWLVFAAQWYTCQNILWFAS